MPSPFAQPAFLRPALILLVLLLVLTAAFATYLSQRTLPAPMNVTIGARGTLADVAPTSAEINAARAQLDDGFIAVLPCTQAGVFELSRTRELADIATQDQLAFRVYDGENDPVRQITQIEQARLDGARAFIICPLSAAPLQDSVKQLQQAQIPLVLSANFDATYGIKLALDEFDIGQQQGMYAADILRTEGRAPTGTPDGIVVLTLDGTMAGDQRVARHHRRLGRFRARRADRRPRLHPRSSRRRRARPDRGGDTVQRRDRLQRRRSAGRG